MNDKINITATSHRDPSVSAHAVKIYTDLANAFASFKEKTPLDAIRDIHDALIECEEFCEGFIGHDTADCILVACIGDYQWTIDFECPSWEVDIPMSIFHNRLIFKSVVEQEEQG